MVGSVAKPQDMGLGSVQQILLAVVRSDFATEPGQWRGRVLGSIWTDPLP
jgi:hypothetical protein